MAFSIVIANVFVSTIHRLCTDQDWSVTFTGCALGTILAIVALMYMYQTQLLSFPF